MPRPVVIRANYRDDAAYLIRLEQAVLKDDRRLPVWRDKIAAQLRSLALQFLEAEQPVVSKPATSDDIQKKKR
jgi:hypothetical protein